MKPTHKDIIIVGAGLSGIGAACHLTKKNPEKSYLILESREKLGGTWSLFKYPGIRSDSDMYTFGFSFKTWESTKSFADAPSILNYLNEAAKEYNVNEHIVYSQRAIYFNFDSLKKLWTITTQNTKTKEQNVFTCNHLLSCSGYYSYEKGYSPKFKNQSEFNGQIIHPQDWPENIDYTNKKIVVIGSGATAVTLVPKLTEKAVHVTMIQRSPTYISTLPNKDIIGNFIKRIFPKKIAYKLIRIKNILLSIIFFNLCMLFPKTMKKFTIKAAKKELGDFPVNPHFIPHYKPWEERFCIAPDGDFFKVMKEKKASIITDHIDCFTASGVKLKSGKKVDADIIVTATGLNLLAFGGVQIFKDNEPFELPKSYVYKGIMLSGLPNFYVFIGYTNASWTLKSDLTSEYISRVLNYLDKNNLKTIEANVKEGVLKPIPLLNLNSGYINRSADTLPKQGNKTPWRVYQNYILDYKLLRINKINDKWVTFY